MRLNPVLGKTILWTFSDGQMKDKSFLHTFSSGGKVSWQSVEDGVAGEPSEPIKCEVASLGQACAISYRVPGGYTLTVMLDFESGKLIAFSSNDKRLDLQHGTFEIVDKETKRGETSHPQH